MSLLHCMTRPVPYGVKLSALCSLPSEIWLPSSMFAYLEIAIDPHRSSALPICHEREVCVPSSLNEKSHPLHSNQFWSHLLPIHVWSSSIWITCLTFLEICIAGSYECEMPKSKIVMENYTSLAHWCSRRRMEGSYCWSSHSTSIIPDRAYIALYWCWSQPVPPRWRPDYESRVCQKKC